MALGGAEGLPAVGRGASSGGVDRGRMLVVGGPASGSGDGEMLLAVGLLERRGGAGSAGGSGSLQERGKALNLTGQGWLVCVGLAHLPGVGRGRSHWPIGMVGWTPALWGWGQDA